MHEERIAGCWFLRDNADERHCGLWVMNLEGWQPEA